MPQMIWFQFKKAFLPAKIIFHRRAHREHAKDDTPIKFKFVGANPSNEDKCAVSSNWKTVCSATYGDNISVDKPRECHINALQARKLGRRFRCLGLKVLEVSGNGRATALQGIEMWSWN